MTTAHRVLALRQNCVILVVSCLTMLSLYEAATVAQAVSPASLRVWAFWTVANIAARATLNIKIFAGHSSAAVVRSISSRLIPLLIALLAGVQWIWTINLFVGGDVGTTLLTFAGLMATSVVVISLWSTSPLAPAVFVTVTWAAFVRQAALSSLFPQPALGAVVLVVIVLLWGCAYLHVQQVRAVLDRSDQLDLVLDGLKQANADLQEANAALSALRSEATTELETRSLFFNSASHDFRQRLHAMKLLANSSLRAQKENSDERPALQRLVHSVEDVESYITDVLDFARTDHPMTVPVRHRVRIQDIFQSLELAFVDVAASSGVALMLRPTNVEVLTDPSMLQRMLENLVSNALKSSSPHVLVAARRRAGDVLLQVWDRGTGIDAQELDSIFVPFHRSASRPPGYAGAGLGMAIVKRFADCLGYSVAIETRQGRGTVVSVLIPAGDV